MNNYFNTNLNNIKIKKCCNTFKKEINDNYYFSFSNDEWHKHYDYVEEGWVVLFMNDGGHGGMLPIKYCPFCGSKIIFKDNTQIKIKPISKKLKKLF
mgnify:CR=1 FL=1